MSRHATCAKPKKAAARLAFAGPAGRGGLRVVGEELAKLLVNGNTRPMLAEAVAFEKIPDALAQLKAGAFQGKVVAHLRN